MGRVNVEKVKMLCECGCGQEVRNRLVKGHQSEQTRQSISLALAGVIPWNKGLTKNTDIRVAKNAVKISRALKGRIRPKEEALKAGISNKGQKRSNEFKEKMSIRTRQVWANPSSLFNNPAFLRERAQRQSLRPTRPELKVLQIIEDNQFPFKYVGDGEVVIGRKCPDFINIDGKKQIIELFGDYWHKKQNPQDRIDLFAKYGFSTLVLWEHELKNPNAVLTKLKEFINADSG